MAPHKWFCACGEPTSLYLERGAAAVASAIAPTPGPADASVPTTEPPEPGDVASESVPPAATPLAESADDGGPPPGRRRSRRLAIGLVVAIALVAGGLFVPRVLRDKGPSYPKAWDPRVRELVSFDESARGLRFKHPVQIEFMEPAAFKKLLSADDSKLSADDRRQIEDYTAMFRALGLIKSDVDLLKAESDINSNGTLAFYSFEDKRIRVRGTTLTPGVRVTLAHELTHVLQDQYFDLGRISDKADTHHEDQEGDVLHGLAEGDADRIEEKYKDSLSEADQKAADAESAQDSNAFNADQYPPVLTAIFGAPYAFGSQLIKVLDAQDGQRAIDDAFRLPPKFDKALLDPLGYLSGEQGHTLPALKPTKGEKEIDHSGFGAFSLYLTLAQRLDEKRALAAADAWRADAILGYRTGGRVCVRLMVQGIDASGTEAIAAALDDWARPAGPGVATVTRAFGNVVLQACDTKSDAVPGRDVTVDDLFTLPLVRAELGAAVLEGKGSLAQARCYGQRGIDRLTLAELQSDEASPALTQRFQAIAVSCRSA